MWSDIKDKLKLNKDNQKYLNAAFLAVLVLFSVLGLVITISGHTDILDYENRTASKLKAFSFADFVDGTFQDNVEESLVDQAVGSNGIKRGYNVAKSTLIDGAIKPLSNYNEDDDSEYHEIIVDDNSDIGGSVIASGEDTTQSENKQEENENVVIGVATESAVEPNTNPTVEPNTEPVNEPERKDLPEVEVAQAEGGKYYSVGGGMYKYGEYVVQGMASLKGNQARFDKYFTRYNELISEYPDLNFYLYYIERDSDQNYASGKRAGISEYIYASVNLPESNMGVEEVRDFETYKEYNFKSDHHWAYKGSYTGYVDIINMLKPDDMPMQPLDELKLGYTKGSFTKTDATANIQDDFIVYELPFPEMEVKFGLKSVSDYGTQASCIAKARAGNTNQNLSYGGYYGGDIGFIDIYNPSGSGTLLIFGNSYDNAVIKPLASHYEHTYSVDMRYYKSVMGSAFSFAKFIEQHPVDDVLAVGNAYYYLQAAFVIPK